MKPGPVNPELLTLAGALAETAPVVSAELAIIEQLFDHLPETVFFMKDARGHYIAVNQSLVERCGCRDKQELIGRHVREIFPKELAKLYAEQDQAVVRTGRPIIDHLELHWYAHRRPGWCLTTKLPMRNQAGSIIGVMDDRTASSDYCLVLFGI